MDRGHRRRHPQNLARPLCLFSQVFSSPRVVQVNDSEGAKESQIKRIILKK